MNRLMLIPLVCALILVICLVIKVKTLLTDLMDSLHDIESPLQALTRISAVLLVLASGAALGYAAFWLTVGTFWILMTSS